MPTTITPPITAGKRKEERSTDCLKNQLPKA
jgi:hypothetical protein